MEAGDPARAVPLFEQILSVQVRTQGGDHLDTLSTRNNLANAVMWAGGLGAGCRAVRADLDRPGAGAGPVPCRHVEHSQRSR
ncbi:tetratricopeptide repeat protein [Kribbella qitaiheensis]|uniref:tetratricopeptide repeat protein n=1 Tax=Kribbella qitaiheensis TaxID=1544730 RepID=UPI003D187F4A